MIFESTSCFIMIFKLVSGNIPSVMFDRLGKNGINYEESTHMHLAHYGDAVLCTLALVYRNFEETDYSEWNATFLRANTTSGADREALLDNTFDFIEKDLILVGITAMENKLKKKGFLGV